jgi:MFS family permease
MNSGYSTRVARRITWVLCTTQSLGSAALIANATVNAIVGAELSGNDALAGLPGTLLLLGAALAAPPAGRLMQRIGRRRGLALGFFVGAIGMLIGGGAIVAHNFALLLLGLLLIGGARGAVDQSRYAAADAQRPERRARAISAVVFAGTVGAIVGPQLVGPSGNLLGWLGVTALAGPMWSGALLFGLAGLLLAVGLRPDPRDIARALAASLPAAQQHSGATRPLRALVRLPAVQLALASMIIGQGVMVLIMAVTPLHMHHHQHGLGAVGLVLTAHTLGMYGLSMLMGAVADRIGRPWTIGLGAATLVAGSLLAPLSPQTPWLALALFLVGLGWNMCYIAGSSLLTESLAPDERGAMQGANEAVVNVVAAGSSFGSGVLLAHGGYGSLALVGAGAALLLLALLGWQRVGRTSPALSVAPRPAQSEL